MVIKYAGRYSPKYYNPNWSPHSSKRVSWNAHNNKKPVSPKPTSTPSSTPKPPNTTK